jgi:virulence-associated protein VapD
MYAIMIDIDIDKLCNHYGNQCGKEHVEICSILEEHKFTYQGGIYLGDHDTSVTSVILAVIDLTTRLPWFVDVVRGIRMLRVEESDDLMQVVQRIKDQVKFRIGSRIIDGRGPRRSGIFPTEKNALYVR